MHAARYYEAPGYDRASVALPQAQVDLVKAVAAVGKPVVVYVLRGRHHHFHTVHANNYFAELKKISTGL